VTKGIFSKVYFCKEKATGADFVIKKVNLHNKRHKLCNNDGEDRIYAKLQELKIRNTVKLIKSWKEDNNQNLFLQLERCQKDLS